MRTKEEVLARLEEMHSRKLAERKEEFLCRNFRNCIHNVRLRVKGNGKMGFCRNPAVITKLGQPIICDEEGTAERCKFFNCRNTEESVERDFDAILKSPARCGEAYPKLAVLIWFLQDYSHHSRLSRLKMSACDMVRSTWKLITGGWW